MKRQILFLAILAGCANVPRDPEDTLERVADTRTFAAGLIATGDDKREATTEQALLARIGKLAGARAKIVSGATEPLLARLEAGELDIVIGQFRKDSPWSKRVTLSKPLLRRPVGEGELHFKAATRQGENRWIMLVDRAVDQADGTGH